MSVSRTYHNTTSYHTCSCCASTFHTRIACHPERGYLDSRDSSPPTFDNIGNELRFPDVKILKIKHIKAKCSEFDERSRVSIDVQQLLQVVSLGCETGGLARCLIIACR